jgi:hypothetical protein
MSKFPELNYDLAIEILVGIYSRPYYWTFLFQATPPRSQRTDYQGQSVLTVANFASLRETKMSSSVILAMLKIFIFLD